MKNLNLPWLLALLLLVIVHPAFAQQQQCTPPNALPTASAPNIFTPEQEVILGDAIAEYIQRDYKVIEDPEVNAYLSTIGERLTKHLPLNRLRFRFFLVDLPDANAFVLPGGRVFVSRKLVAAALNEDELAGVIAHELGHLVAHDSAIDVTRQFKEVLGVTTVSDRKDIFDKYNQLIENLNRKPGAFKVGDREKGQLFADQAGLYALVAAGYEAASMARFWDRVTGTQGKKGSWFSDLFGTTRPEQRRLREMTKGAEALPAACRQRPPATQTEVFAQWQSNVIAYTGLGRRESVHGVLSKHQLNPPLQSDILHLRFSPDGTYLLAQDDAGINVLSREPFAPIFRINSENVKKSAILEFPTGKVLTELELWRPGMTGATRGDYLLIRPIKDYALGVMDLNTRTIGKVNKRAALDIYAPFFVAEMRNGEVGLYRMEKNELVATTLLSNTTIGRLRVAEVSPELKWLALSGRSRGGVWNLSKGEAALSLRDFRGGYVSDDGHFFADFPKVEDVERNIAKFNLNTGEAVSGPKIESNSSYQYGQYLFTIKPLADKARKDIEFIDKTQEIRRNPMDYRRNVMVELFDARTMKVLWSQTFPKEAPRVWIAPNNQTMAMVWDVSSETAKAEISADPQLKQQLAKMKEKEGDYFLKILDAENGKEISKLLIETGKASFRVSNIFATGDSVIVRDNQNRVLVYSLKTGEQKGRVFGSYATVSTVSKLLCVENETGKIAVYDLETMEKRDDFSFSSPISMMRFSQDGKRLFVLTTAQTVYILDVASLVKE